MIIYSLVGAIIAFLFCLGFAFRRPWKENKFMVFAWALATYSLSQDYMVHVYGVEHWIRGWHTSSFIGPFVHLYFQSSLHRYRKDDRQRNGKINHKLFWLPPIVILLDLLDRNGLRLIPISGDYFPPLMDCMFLALNGFTMGMAGFYLIPFLKIKGLKYKWSIYFKTTFGLLFALSLTQLVIIGIVIFRPDWINYSAPFIGLVIAGFAATQLLFSNTTNLRLTDTELKRSIDKKNKSPEIISMGREIESYLLSKKPFIDPGYQLKDLADDMGQSANTVSRAINEYFELSFPELLTQLKLDEAVNTWKKKQSDYSLLGLAMASGFGSKSKFYQAFKERYGTTPKNYFTKLVKDNDLSTNFE